MEEGKREGNGVQNPLEAVPTVDRAQLAEKQRLIREKYRQEEGETGPGSRDAAEATSKAQKVQELPTAGPKKEEGKREWMIDTAVRFMSNPEVASSPASKKIAFLKHKGLTAAEIQEVLLRTGVSPSDPGLVSAAAPPPPPPPPPPVVVRERGGGVGMLALGVLVGGLASAAIAAYLNYRGEHRARAEEAQKRAAEASEAAAKSEEKALEDEKALQELANQVQLLGESQESHRAQLAVQLQAIQAAQNAARKASPAGALEEGMVSLKTELAAVRALLRDRMAREDPPAAAVRVVSTPPPRVPAWQLASPATTTAPAAAGDEKASALVVPDEPKTKIEGSAESE